MPRHRPHRQEDYDRKAGEFLAALPDDASWTAYKERERRRRWVGWLCWAVFLGLVVLVWAVCFGLFAPGAF